MLNSLILSVSVAEITHACDFLNSIISKAHAFVLHSQMSLIFVSTVLLEALNIFEDTRVITERSLQHLCVVQHYSVLYDRC